MRTRAVSMSSTISGRSDADVNMKFSALFGRDTELRVLRTLIERIGDEGGAVVVVGEAGIGKSSVLQRAAQQARQAGCQVLAATGVQTESQLPFAGLHQLLEPVLDRAATLPGVQRRALF